MATMQHHDAVTGTEKQHVAEDYAMRMTEGNRAVLSFLGPILFDKAGINISRGSSDFWCPLVNTGQCHLTETEANFNVLVYNPLSRYNNTYIVCIIESKGRIMYK